LNLFLDFHVEGGFGLSEVVDSDDEFDSFRSLIKFEELLHFLVILPKLEEFVVSALYIGNFCGFHPLDDFFEHFTGRVVIKITFPDAIKLT
jgi:hypothetical protein